MNKHQLFVSIAALLAFGFAATSPANAVPRHPNVPPPTIASSIWSNFGPSNVVASSVQDNGTGPITGRINCTAIDPFNSSVLYAATAGGGLWKTANSGFSWTPISDVAPWTASTVNTVAISPANDQEIWAGTGDLVGFRSNPQLVGSGVMKSLDGGNTWTQIGLADFGTSQVTAILFDPDNPDTVVVATAGGTGTNPSEIWQSTDDGVTFKPVVGVSADWQSLSASIPNNGQRTFYAIGAATSGGGTLVYTSVDGGATWTAGGTTSSGTGELGLQIAASQVNPTTVYAAAAADKDIYVSVNSGTTWTSISNGGIDTASGPTILLAVEAMQPSSGPAIDALYSGKHDAHISVNGGATWQTLSASGTGNAKISVGPISMAFYPSLPNTSLIATDQGVYQFTYAAGASNPVNSSTFSSLNATLNASTVNKAAFDPMTAESAMASFPQDSIGGPGSAAFTSFGLASWQGIPGGGDCAINVNDSSEQFTSASAGQQALVFQTFDSWADNVAIPLPQVAGDNVPTSPVLSYDAVNGILYMGTAYLNSLNDQTDAWTTQLGNQRLTAGGNDTISAIAIAPTNPNVIYTGSQQGQIWMTQNQGVTWVRIDNGQVPLPAGVQITSIAVNFDPNNPNAAFDVLVTDGNATDGHVYHSGNTGASGGVDWSDLSANLPAASYYTVVRDIDSPSSVFYVGCDFGMFYTVNSGSNWVNGTRALGLPIVPVSELQAVPATRFLNAATLGRGVWQIAFPAPTPTITAVSPNTGVVNGPDVAINVQGTGYFTGSTVFFNSTPLTTSYESSSDLTATIPSNLMTAAGADSITVVNPSPGNTSNAAVFMVTNPTPVILSLSPAGAVVGSGTFTLTVNGTGFYSGSVIQWNGAPVTTTFVSSTVLTAVIAKSNLTQLGTVPVTVLNSGVPVSNSVLFTIGNASPVAQVLSPSSAAAGSPNLNVVISGTGFIAGSVVNWQSVTLQTSTVLVPTLNGTQLDVTVPANLLATGQVVSVTVTNPAPGGGTSPPLTFIVSNTVPTITQIMPTVVGAGSSDLQLTVSGTNFAQGVLISVNGTLYTPSVASTTSATITVPAAAMAVGGYYPVTAINPAPGGGASAAVTFEVDNPIPTINSVSPNTAAAGSPALSIAVSGSGFVQTSIVEWNGQPLATTYQSGVALTAVIPLFDVSTGTVGNITVVSPSPSGGASGQVPFVVTNPVPTLVSTSPSGATTGGPSLTILLTGTNFVPGSVVSWTSTTSTVSTILASTFVDATNLQATISSSLIAAAGTGTIIVTNPAPGGGVTAGVSVLISNGVPVVLSLSPNAVGIKSPTLTMTVTGNSFAAGATVLWTPITTPASAAVILATTYVSGSELTAVVPNGLLTTAGTATVSVSNLPPGGGTSAANQTFTIGNPVPVLSSLSPTTGLAGASNLVLTLGGTNFVPTSVVTLGTVPLVTTFVSPNLLTAIVPQSLVPTAGQQTVTVVNPAPGGGASAGIVFTVVPVHTYPAGLQMLSAPYDYSSTDFTTLLGLGPSTVAIYEPLLDQYAINPSYPADTMRLGYSYWARLPKPEVLQVQGVAAPTGQKYPIAIEPTWNQIADPFPSPVALSTCTVTITGGSPVTFAAASQPSINIIYPTVYSYDSVNNVYVPHYIGNPIEPNPVLQPFMGYWLAAKSSCTLNVTPPSGG